MVRVATGDMQKGRLRHFFGPSGLRSRLLVTVAEMSPIEHRFCTIIRRTFAELLACGKESRGVGFCLDVSWERFRRGKGREGREGGDCCCRLSRTARAGVGMFCLVVGSGSRCQRIPFAGILFPPTFTLRAYGYSA